MRTIGYLGTGMQIERLNRLALVVSVLLHAALIVPPMVPDLEIEMEEDPGEIEDTGAAYVAPLEPLPDVPFRVTVLEEAQAPPPPAPPEPEAPPAPPPEPKPKPEEPPEERKPVEVKPKPPEPPPEPPPEVAEAPPEPPPLPEGGLADVGGMEEEDEAAPTEDDDGEAFEAAAEKKPGRPRAKPPARPKKPQTPCPPPVEAITQIDATTWSIERELIDYYADHLPKLYELGRVWVHRDKDKNPDGFRIALSRCSVLRQGGLRSGDIVNAVNDRQIYTVLQGVAAYMAFRNQPTLELHITRGKKQIVLTYHIEPKRKRRQNREGREGR